MALRGVRTPPREGRAAWLGAACSGRPSAGPATPAGAAACGASAACAPARPRARVKWCVRRSVKRRSAALLCAAASCAAAALGLAVALAVARGLSGPSAARALPARLRPAPARGRAWYRASPPLPQLRLRPRWPKAPARAGHHGPAGGSARSGGVGRRALLLQWWLEDMVCIGPVRMGLPGLATLAVFFNPMFEVMPQMLRQRNVGGLPMLPYSTMVAGGLVWSTYGMLSGAQTVLVANLFSVFLGALYCAIYFRFGSGPSYAYTWHAIGALAAGFGCAVSAAWLPRDVALLGLGLAGNAMCMILSGSPLAVIRKVMIDANTSCLPFGFTCVTLFNNMVWLVYASLVLQDWLVFMPNVVGILLGGAQLALFLRYGISH